MRCRVPGTMGEVWQWAVSNGMGGVRVGGHLRNLVSCCRPWAAQLLVYEANQKLHVPKAKRRSHYCWETLGGHPAATGEGLAQPLPTLPVPSAQQARYSSSSSSCLWFPVSHDGEGGPPHASECKILKQSSRRPRSPPRAQLPAGLVSGQGRRSYSPVRHGRGRAPGNKALRPDFSQKDACLNETKPVIKHPREKKDKATIVTVTLGGPGGV